jgi:DNA polymerase V
MPDPFALVDCNNFFVSCVRVYEPQLRGRPVVVLSNNDGCMIARSNEAKALGLPMGAPAFKHRETIRRHGVVVKSSNFSLFSDLSERIYETLGRFSPEVEKYSIDESFLRLPEMVAPAHIKREVYRYTRIPVSVGVAGTKTLAKAANSMAKLEPRYEGCLILPDGPTADPYLEGLEVRKVWGIGPSWSARLAELGIPNARALKYARDGLIRQKLNVVGLRVVHELRGMPCLDLEQVMPDRQQTICSRSFGTPLTTYESVREAVAAYTAIAARRLRDARQQASTLHVYLTTKHHGTGPHYTNSHAAMLPEPTAYTPLLVKYAGRAFDRIWRPGYAYRRAGVVFTGLSNSRFVQLDAFEGDRRRQESALMRALDAINTKYGRDTVFLGSSGTEREWLSRSTEKSPCYTTQWTDLLRVG